MTYNPGRTKKQQPGLVWIPEEAAYRPNRAAQRRLGFQAVLDAIEATHREWARAISFLLIGR